MSNGQTINPAWAGLRLLSVALLTLVLGCHAGAEPVGQASSEPQLPRVIVSTDLGGLDEDDYQSMVHYLVYADRFETEGLISSPPGDGRAEHILQCIEAYAEDYANLRTHSQGYPEPDALRAVVRQGVLEPQAGEEPDERISAGAQHLIDRAHAEDDRPLYVLVWGSMTDVAQALHADPTIIESIRVVSIGSWNTRLDRRARDYVYNHHPDLWWVESDTTFRGMYVGGDQQGDLGNVTFPLQHVNGHGALGALFMQMKPDIKMGDTPTVLYLLHGDRDDPAGERWAGSYTRPDPEDRPTYWHDRRGEAEGQYPGARTVNRHRHAILSDWMRRMDRAQAPAEQ